jgi:hypothetical protein
MKNKTPQRNTGFKNSLYLGIFIIIILAGFISMIAVNIYRYVSPYEENSEVVQDYNYGRDTIYLPSPSKEIIVHDTIWRTRPVNKIKTQEIKDSL